MSSPRTSPRSPKTRSRGYVDGCFDLMHSGHYNALRQAKALCDTLIIGIHSDDEISIHKGPPVLKQAERYAMLEHIKWIDEVAYDVPYVPSLKTLESCKADFVVHGDDMPVSADGKCAYEEIIEAGKLKIVKRTEGVSTTDLVGRMLLLTRDHLNDPVAKATAKELIENSPRKGVERSPESSSKARVKMLTTARRIAEFSSRRPITPEDTVVYIDGAFDLFNVGHASTLKKARQLGTYLVVGIFDDETVNRMKGVNYPIMNLHERVLNVCSCKWVDDVVIGAPIEVDDDLIKTMNISVVAQGTLTNSDKYEAYGDVQPKNHYAKEMGIFREVKSDWPNLTTSEIAHRIAENRLSYLNRNAKRGRMEQEYYRNKKHQTEK